MQGLMLLTFVKDVRQVCSGGVGDGGLLLGLIFVEGVVTVPFT